jgi:tRNA pseudouridine32 synthase / 23S rRNA pseudouridine746 synthase
MGMDSPVNYWYTGSCPYSGELLQLPRTQEVETIAHELMTQLAQDHQFTHHEGKMYGVMLAETEIGKRLILKAFSGRLNGESTIDSWVPAIPGRDQVAAAETGTLADLAAMKQELIELDRAVEREQYRLLAGDFTTRLEKLAIEHRQRQEFRQEERKKFTDNLSDKTLKTALDRLAENSRQDKRERRQLKQERDQVLQPLQEILELNDGRIRDLKQQRKIRSRQLQVQMHDAYRLMNFLGTSVSLRELMPAGIPTGTGECCAPKLLHYAAIHQLKPIAMAEFWWGENSSDKCQGEFYGACAERCQPLMGFMLSGLSSQAQGDALPIVYEDRYLIAVDKPAGLLSVPGRDLDGQDCALSRLRQLFPGEEILTVHRLDRDTSGILLLARDRDTYRHLTQQFQDRQIQKVYEAVLGGNLSHQISGSIDLPLWGDPHDRPRQKVDLDQGKPSLTKFQVLGQIGDYTRIEFKPITGRTHQLRVHAADPQGLGIPILGDRLYGCQQNNIDRLHLHAQALSFTHPTRFNPIQLQTTPPF